ncbi:MULTISPECIES: HD domain-containing protein [unclassified Salinibacterium]|uniref:HD domain-containing protein n=1 Tax=unclassified Salinibacterium TaxID=2632331 RepID=UPI0014203F18|nr:MULTISPECIES: HD domain-containing protein [unclassified Salinibacterium]
MTSANNPAASAGHSAQQLDADALADDFVAGYPVRPVPADGPVDSSPIATTPAALDDLDGLWRAVVPETRTRGNDIHLPISLAFAERLCRAYPSADAELVRVATLLHDTGWAHVDESRIMSEGFTGNWRTSDIRYEHEREGCDVARRVLPGLGYSDEFIERVCLIIDGHDTRPVAYSLEDAMMRDADRLWRFDHAGIALASSWFKMDPAMYTDRLISEILPELITQAALDMATADIARSRALLKTAVLR